MRESVSPGGLWFNGVAMANGLTTKQEAFVAAYLGPCRFNATKAAESAGYAHPNKQGPALLVNLGIQELVKAWRDEAKQAAITDLSYRLSRLDEIERRYWDLIEDRAAKYGKEDAPGATTGLVVKQYKMVGSGEGATLVEEWVADTAVTKEIRATHEQAAKELGQWKDNVNLSGEVGVRRYIGVDPDAV